MRTTERKKMNVPPIGSRVYNITRLPASNKRKVAEISE